MVVVLVLIIIRRLSSTCNTPKLTGDIVFILEINTYSIKIIILRFYNAINLSSVSYVVIKACKNVISYFVLILN